MSFPILFVIEFLHNHCMLQVNKRPVWKTVKGGSKEYVKKLLFGLKNLVIVKQPVWKVVRNARDVSIYTDNGKKEDFDEVVVFEDNVKNIRTIRKVVTDAGYKLETNRVTNKGVYTRSQ